MSKFSFNLKRKELIDQIRDPIIYEFNLAKNLALLSNDPAIIRRFYQIDVMQYFKDPWLIMQIEDSFFRNYLRDQAFAYFGLIPMIVQSMVNLVAGGGFDCDSGNSQVDDNLNRLKESESLEQHFISGVYWETGIGDFAYRISYDPAHDQLKPLIDIVEPHHLEVNRNRGSIVSYVVKEVSEDDPSYELHEIHHINDDGFLTISYRFVVNGEYVAPNDKPMLKLCGTYFPSVDTSDKILPFRDFATIVYKQNPNQNKLYKGERGVPDIQGLDTIEEALTETISDLIDAIRMGGLKVFLDQDLVPQNAQGENQRVNYFNKRIIKPKGTGSTDGGNKLFETIQGNIDWEAHIKPIQTLCSWGINKASLSPTTVGLTGLESINSSAESQEARERTSIRTRELRLNSWAPKLRELINNYLRIDDYINNREILDYSGLIKIKFKDYINPSVENITEVLARQVDAGLKSHETAIKDLNEGFEQEDAKVELMKIESEEIVGIPPQ